MSKKPQQVKIETKILSFPSAVWEMLKGLGLFVPSKTLKGEDKASIIEEILYEMVLENESITVDKLAEMSSIVDGTELSALLDNTADRLHKVRPFKLVTEVTQNVKPVKNVKR